jgi:hypothetical protein
MFNGSRHPRLLIGASSVERLQDRSQRAEARIWESFQMLFFANVPINSQEYER